MFFGMSAQIPKETHWRIFDSGLARLSRKCHVNDMWNLGGHFMRGVRRARGQTGDSYCEGSTMGDSQVGGQTGDSHILSVLE